MEPRYLLSATKLPLERPAVRAAPVVHRKNDPLECATKVLERVRERPRHVLRVVAEDAASPGAEDEAAMLMVRGDGEDLARARLQHVANLVADGRISLQRRAGIGSGCRDDRERKQIFQEAELIVAKERNVR